jgi:hypothetical protein
MGIVGEGTAKKKEILFLMEETVVTVYLAARR